MIVSLSWAGQATPVQRATASPLGRATSEPQTGQWSGMRNFFSSPVRFSGDHPHDFGDHIPGPLDDHRVADAHVLAVDLILIVKRRAADRHASDADRLQDCRRGQGSCSPDVHLDVQDLRSGLPGFELEGQGPAGTAGDGSQGFLQGEGVDLDYDPVDLIGELFSLRPFPGKIPGPLRYRGTLLRGVDL